jgi:hypothetical protein
METRKTIDIQFYHANNKEQHRSIFAKSRFVDGQYTAAVSVPNKAELLSFLGQSLQGEIDAFQFMVGVTHVIKNDQYNRKIGRIKSTQAIKPQQYKDYEVSLGDKGVVHITFFGGLSGGPKLTFEIKEGRERVYLIGVYN